MEEKMLPWKVWDWDCNLILGLRAPSPSSAPPRPPVYSKTSARNLVKTHLLIGRRPKIQWSQNVLHFHRNPFSPDSGMHKEGGCTYTQITKTSVPLPSPSCWGKQSMPAYRIFTCFRHTCPHVWSYLIYPLPFDICFQYFWAFCLLCHIKKSCFGKPY